MKAKISDLKYRINNLIPKKICNYFIDVLKKIKNFLTMKAVIKI